MSNQHQYTCPKDWDDDEIGEAIIKLLGLKVKRSNGRVQTSEGDKSPCGLTRTIRAAMSHNHKGLSKNTG